MSKVYKVDIKLDTSKMNPSNQVLMKQVPKEADPKNPDVEWDARGFKERTGPEIFVVVAGSGIGGAFPKGGYEQLKNYRRIVANIDQAVKTGELIANKTDIDIIKQAINQNQNWPNNTSFFDVLEQIMARLDNVVEITENPNGVQEESKK